MHLIDVQDMPRNSHRFFVDEAKEGKEFNLAKQFNTHESLLDRRSNRLTLEQLEKIELPDWLDSEFLKEMEKKRSKKYKELIQRVSRNESLRKLEANYDLKTVKKINKFNQSYNSKTKFLKTRQQLIQKKNTMTNMYKITHQLTQIIVNSIKNIPK